MTLKEEVEELTPAERAAFKQAVFEENLRMVLRDARYVLDHLEEFEEI